MTSQVDIVDHPVDIVGRDPEDRGEEAKVLRHGEIAVHTRLLRDIADPAAQLGRTGRQAEHLDSAGDLGLQSDDRPDQCGLAAPRRPQQPRHRPDGEVEPQAVQDFPIAAHHDHVATPHRVFHHMMNLARTTPFGNPSGGQAVR